MLPSTTDTKLSDRATIRVSRNMPASEIIALLAKRCLDITNRLSLEKCGSVPIAGGGFGDIYLGGLTGGEYVAIKCGRLYLQDDPDGCKVIQDAAHELYVWSRLKHNNVLELLGLAQFRDRMAMISPWMDNGTLLQYIKRDPTVDRYLLSVEISEGVAYLHENGAIHGDIKSANVLISSEGVAKLADFGCTVLKKSTLDFSVTTNGSNFSIRWAAPEILSGSTERSKNADVYALGMTLLEVVTGEIPFHGKQDMAVSHARCAMRQIPDRPGEFPSFKENEAGLLWDIMLNCWAYTPSDRPDSGTVKNRLKGIKQHVGQSYELPCQEGTDGRLEDFTNLHGLIIGINKHKYLPHCDLDGCVSDATSVYNYFVDTLRVPPKQLLCLLDEQATRKGILDAFRKHLILNENIRPSDPIVFYFSGIGDRQKAPTQWHSSDGYAQLILPHDSSPWDEQLDPSTCATNIKSSAYDPNKHYRHGITNKTLGRLIHQLHKAKGDNITIIFDCCHSGGALGGYGQETHVLLSACKNDELAQEIPDNDSAMDESIAPPVSSLFTKALLTVLQECDLATTSYSTLMANVQKRTIDIMSQMAKRYGDMEPQMPQCEGRKQNRLLFRTQLALSKEVAQLPQNPTSGRIRVKGSISSAQKGTASGKSPEDNRQPVAPDSKLAIDGGGSIDGGDEQQQLTRKWWFWWG